MVCYPCLVGGSEYKAYTGKGFDNPLQIKKDIMMYNDHENAYLQSGAGLGRFIPIPVKIKPPDVYSGAMKFNEFKEKNFMRGGKLLFMTYQLECSNKQYMEQERFYVAEIPFRTVTYSDGTLTFNTNRSVMLRAWNGVNIEVKSDKHQILSVKSSPTIIKDMAMPFGALFVKTDLTF
jgi:hypothetical protein